jgi:hypothetical protein
MAPPQAVETGTFETRLLRDTMERHPFRRRLIAASVASLAAAIVVPAPSFACSQPFACGQKASAAACCCKNHQATASGTTSPDTSSPDSCLTKTCGCSRPVAPQNTPPVPPTLPLTSAAIPADAASFHGGTELTAPVAGSTLAGDLAAIPHRILHCTWLI